MLGARISPSTVPYAAVHSRGASCARGQVIQTPSACFTSTSSEGTPSLGRKVQPLFGVKGQTCVSSRKRVRRCDIGLRVNGVLATDPTHAADQTNYQKLAIIEHAGGSLTTVKVHFPNMKTRILRVWTPPGYRQPGEIDPKYPVLYLNDGQNLFEDH
eukprot:1971215-Pyramimonas_sp.AAC.2